MGIFGNSGERENLRRTIDILTSEIGDLDQEIAANLNQAIALKRPISIANATKWEYLVREDVEEADLDEHGLNGWELVSAVSFTTGFGLGGNTSMKVHMRYIFKRAHAELYPDSAQPYLAAISVLEQKKHELALEVAAAQNDLDVI